MVLNTQTTKTNKSRNLNPPCVERGQRRCNCMCCSRGGGGGGGGDGGGGVIIKLKVCSVS